MDNFPLLTVYAQPFEHFPAYIAGNREGLLALRAAIDKALDGQDAQAEEFQSDGEGYEVNILQVSGNDADLLRCFYTEETAWDRRETARDPFHILEERAASLHPPPLPKEP